MEKRAAMHAKGKRESWPCVLMPAPALSKKQEENTLPLSASFPTFWKRSTGARFFFFLSLAPMQECLGMSSQVFSSG